jgi:hypothetical protein
VTAARIFVSLALAVVALPARPAHADQPKAAEGRPGLRLVEAKAPAVSERWEVDQQLFVESKDAPLAAKATQARAAQPAPRRPAGKGDK